MTPLSSNSHCRTDPLNCIAKSSQGQGATAWAAAGRQLQEQLTGTQRNSTGKTRWSLRSTIKHRERGLTWAARLPHCPIPKGSRSASTACTSPVLAQSHNAALAHERHNSQSRKVQGSQFCQASYSFIPSLFLCQDAAKVNLPSTTFK